MSTAHEIEAAIRLLSPGEREKLIKDLPILLPELDGDLAWNRILGDTRKRPALTALLDQAERDFKKNPEEFPKISLKDFDSRS
jgi:hypothetical protein